MTKAKNFDILKDAETQKRFKMVKSEISKPVSPYWVDKTNKQGNEQQVRPNINNQPSLLR